MHVGLHQITGVRFVREPYPFQSDPELESLMVRFLGPGEDAVLYCYVHDCMTASRCGRRSWQLGRRCANGTATATSQESIKAPSWPRVPESS